MTTHSEGQETAIRTVAVAPPGGCLICGDGQVVTNPSGLFVFPGQPTSLCDDLQTAGLLGQIPPDQCPLLPPLLGACACAPVSLENVPTPVPSSSKPTTPPSQVNSPITIRPATVPVSATIVPTIVASPTPTNYSGEGCQLPKSPTGCSVCGDGKCVGNPDAIFSFTDTPDVSCGVLEEAGLSGRIPLDRCPLLLGLIETLCDCGSHSNQIGSPSPSVVATSHVPNNSSTNAPTDVVSFLPPTAPLPSSLPTAMPITTTTPPTTPPTTVPPSTILPTPAPVVPPSTPPSTLLPTGVVNPPSVVSIPTRNRLPTTSTNSTTTGKGNIKRGGGMGKMSKGKSSTATQRSPIPTATVGS